MYRPRTINKQKQQENARAFVAGLSRCGLSDLRLLLSKDTMHPNQNANSVISALRLALKEANQDNDKITQAENKIKEAERNLEEARAELRKARNQ